MKKIENALHSLVVSMEGTVIGIGIEFPRLIDELERNDHITECTLLNEKINQSETSGKGGMKKIHIRKIRRKFKKKKIDHVLCNMEEMFPYMKTFVKDSIYITRGKIYYYGNDLDQMEMLKKRYGRYTVEWQMEKCGNTYLATIEVGSTKNHKFKEIFYYIKDTFTNGMDYMSDYLLH